MMTRAVNVEALKPCSAPTMKYASRARAVRRVGPLAGELVEEALDEIERRIGLDRLLALADPGERRQRRRRERGQGACLLDGRRPVEVLRRAPRGDRGPQRVHRLGVVGAARGGSSGRRPGPAPSARRAFGSQSPVQSRFATAG